MSNKKEMMIAKKEVLCEHVAPYELLVYQVPTGFLSTILYLLDFSKPRKVSVITKLDTPEKAESDTVYVSLISNSIPQEIELKNNGLKSYSTKNLDYGKNTLYLIYEERKGWKILGEVAEIIQ